MNGVESVKKRILVLTIFENQIIRNIILNNKGNLLKTLVDNFEVIILTNTELSKTVKNTLEKLELRDITIEIVEVIKQNFFYNLLSVFAKNMNASSSNIWSRNRNYALNNFSLIGLISRGVINRLFAKHKLFHKALRVFMMYVVNTKQLKLSKAIEKSDIVILTSTTNFRWDLPIGQIAARKKKKIIAIPRSWDNFTSHGAIRIRPDIIYSFSPSMSKYLINYHFFEERQIIEVKNPAYDNKDLLSYKVLEQPQSRKILYACMGSYLYEQESLFIEILFEKVSQAGFDLEVLKHPKFETPDIKGINYKSISYEEFSTQNLLQEHLSKYRLVLTAGSSIALDCYNYNVDFICVFVENLAIDYWRSVKRYTDTVEHFLDFLADNNVKVLTDLTQIQIELTEINTQPNKRMGALKHAHEPVPFISDEILNTIYRIIN